MGGIKTISIIVAANIKGLEAGLGKANKSIGKFASNAARLGSMLSFGVTAPLTALGKSAFDTFAQFEDGMTRVQAVTGASAEQIKMLTAEAKRLGATTQFTALQVADLQLVLGRKGFDPTAIKNMEGAILDLALATGEDLSLAAEVVANSINAFNLEADESSRVANTLASAAANSSIQLSTFATAFGHAGASANAVGVDLEELSAMMGVLMDNGIKASKAGTGLRKIFMKLSKDGTDFTKVLDLATQGELGLQKAMALAGVTSANQLLILAKNKKKIAELTEEYRTNTDALDKMTDLMGKTTKAKVAIMNSAIEGMKLEMGALLAEALLPLILKITDLASSFQNLEPSTKKIILVVAGLAAVVGPLLLTLALFASAIGALAPAFTALIALIPFSITGLSTFGIMLGKMAVAGYSASGALGVLAGAFRAVTVAIAANPVGAIAVALAAVGVAIYSLSNDTDDATESLENFDAPALTAAERLEQINKQLNDYGKGFGEILKEELEENITTTKEKIKELQKAVNGFSVIGSTIAETALFSEQEKELRDSIELLGDYEKALQKIADNDALDDSLIDSTENFKTAKTEAQLYMDMLEGLDGKPKQQEGSPIKLKKTAPIDVPENDVLSGFSQQLDNAAWKVSNLAQEYGVAFSQMGQITSQFFANKAAENENWYNKEKQTIEQSEMNEQAKAEALQDLEAKMAEKTAKLKAKQAKADKVAGMFNAAINTAVAVTKVVANPVLAAIVAGLGAVQMAAIAAQPIPGFADGGRPPLGKLSMVGERGPELFVPDQAGTIIPNHALGGGGTVIPDVRISGNDLLIVFDRAERRKNRR